MGRTCGNTLLRGKLSQVIPEEFALENSSHHGRRAGPGFDNGIEFRPLQLLECVTLPATGLDVGDDPDSQVDRSLNASRIADITHQGRLGALS
ncbi:MAG: hypothetical protein JWO04_1533 [Gammaproteobacteria bacterium]|nr:hypothetical protein [Gammaproteobacteria bacterium]